VTVIHHVQLACPPGSEDASRDFYAGVLGLEEVDKPPVLAARGGCWFRGHGIELHLGVEHDFRPARKAHPGLLVTNLDAWADRLTAAGYPADRDEDFPGMRRFYSYDPHGNRLEFLQPLPARPHAGGGIDFADPAGARTYSGRAADPSWVQALTDLADPAGADAVDLGCGGGTYVRALHDLGAHSVTGVDSSTPILAQARTDHGHLTGVRFHHADATSTDLPDASADLVLARALVHHLPDHEALAREAARLLRPGGTLVIQDRTAADVTQPAGPRHLRGHLLELAPQLLPVEVGRRPDAGALLRALESAGLTGATTRTAWETRAHYPDRESYLTEIATRAGRSLLHHLTDDELDRLVNDLRERLPDEPLVEQDRWTLWAATKP